MKQIFLNKGSVVLEECSPPACDAHSILVRVAYSFVSSGTEAATVAANQDSLIARLIKRAPFYALKVMQSVRENGVSGTISLVKGKMHQLLALGYSCSGEVIAVGSSVTHFKVGDFVACGGAGSASHAEFVAIPSHLAVRLASAKNLKAASVTTIGAIALQGVRRADVRLGETVCVVGLGLIGQITVQLLKRSGCTVIGVDILPERLALAMEMGCKRIFNPRECDLKREIDFLSEHHGVDATIITAGSSSGELINQAMEITRRKGKVVLVGDVKIDFDRAVFYAKEIDFLISCSYGPGRYDHEYEKRSLDYPYAYVRWTENRNLQLIASLIETGELLIDPIISHEFTLDQVEEAYNYLQEKKALGIVLRYTHSHKTIYPAQRDTSSSMQAVAKALAYKAPQGTLNVALIGFGGFTQVKLLPLFAKHNKVKIDAIIDTDPALALNGKYQNGATFVSNNYQEIVSRSNVHVAVIATPHALHARQTLDLLRAGKAVFCEKPAAITPDELQEITSFIREHPAALYAVDFNRSFAPYSRRIKDSIAKRVSPLIITYRMNAGYIPASHWVQDPMHGGRIIGEACHIFELFCFLTDAAPQSVSVEVLHSTKRDLSMYDNVAVHLRFSDGSLCNLIYTALGNSLLPKERMEVFFDGKSIVMEDYKKVTVYGLPSSYNSSSHEADKGHAELVSRFIEAAQTGGASPIAFERIYYATRISFLVDRLARQGGGHEVMGLYAGADVSKREYERAGEVL